MRQQAPSAPMGQGFMVLARSKIVSTPSAAAFFSNSWAAGSMDSFAKSNSAIKIILQFLTFRGDLHGPSWHGEPAFWWHPNPASEEGWAPGQWGNIPGQPRALASQF